MGHSFAKYRPCTRSDPHNLQMLPGSTGPPNAVDLSVGVARQRKNKPPRFAMPMTVAQVVEETSRWPADQVEVLFERLLASHYRPPDPALDSEWAEQLKRRIDDIESGREVGVPGEEVMARVRKIVGM